MKTSDIRLHLATIRRAFSALEFLNQKDWCPYLDRLFDMCRDEEKSHRGFGSDFRKYHPNAPSIADMARLFAVRRIAEYLNGEPLPQGKIFLHCQKSIFQAAGLVDAYRDEIRAKWLEEGFNLADLASLNYTDFVKVEN
jgi:hypothetical protein